MGRHLFLCFFDVVVRLDLCGCRGHGAFAVFVYFKPRMHMCQPLGKKKGRINCCFQTCLRAVSRHKVNWVWERPSFFFFLLLLIICRVACRTLPRPSCVLLRSQANWRVLLRSCDVVLARFVKKCAPVSLRVRDSSQVRAVIVENTFISVSHMVDKLMPMLSGIKWLVLRLKWDNEEKARRLTRPVLYISGKRPSTLASHPLRGVWLAGVWCGWSFVWVFSACLVWENSVVTSLGWVMRCLSFLVYSRRWAAGAAFHAPTGYFA